ncbi:hypothetical protein BKA83DRAFT_4125851 [Pisolithus microcarpus]|nr:hypothetical protein BKA83DRAFT_4125851 [Pisolithus microcarpus]
MPIVATSQLPCNIQSLSLLCDFLVDYPGELQEQADKHVAKFKKMFLVIQATAATDECYSLEYKWLSLDMPAINHRARLVATGNFLGWEDSSWPGSSASFKVHLGIMRRIIALKSVAIAVGITHEIGAFLAENPPTALDKFVIGHVTMTE